MNLSNDMNRDSFQINSAIAVARGWFESMNWTVFPFQQQAWESYLNGYSGLINAPTGFGKTYSLLIPILLEIAGSMERRSLKAIWISPIRALTKELKLSCEKAVAGLNISCRVEIRTGDTDSSTRQNQLSKPPDILITTPESLHVIMSSKNYKEFFKDLRVIVADEWHELMGSKRGVQIELAISRLRGINRDLKVWGISATIQNIDQALEVLLGVNWKEQERCIIKSGIKKIISVETVIPDEIEKYPWAGHLGIRLLDKILEIIHASRSTIIFTNTRSQCEIWYQKLLDSDSSLAGDMAMHHGSLSRDVRDWVEDALHAGSIRAVVSTSSLDLGVDFRPVESIIQIGSPKGVARFIQRAGRSGHSPGAISKIYFVPTHSLEMIEGAALRAAISRGELEPRIPYVRCFDVLIQYLMTLGIGDGFEQETIFSEIINTHCFSSISREEWQWVLDFLVRGGRSLEAYDQYHRMTRVGNFFKVTDRRISRIHKLSIGTIVSDVSLAVQVIRGKRLGTIEEWFISSLNPGDVFWFAGQTLEFVRLKDMTVYVRPSSKSKGRVPSWGGGRLPLSSMLSHMIQEKLHNYARGQVDEIELEMMKPLFDLQSELSELVEEGRFLIEYFQSEDGYHVLMYPFEGRAVHEGMAAMLAQRIARNKPISFSIAMNDYGFELLSDQELDPKLLSKELFSTKNLNADIQASMNAVEMSRRKFRDIAKISGLIFQGFPGKYKKEKHLQSSSSLLYDVFHSYEPDNLLYLQTFDEVLTFQFEEQRLRKALNKIQSMNIAVVYPESFTPLAFPIIVDRLSRNNLSSESLKSRVIRMLSQSGKS